MISRKEKTHLDIKIIEIFVGVGITTLNKDTLSLRIRLPTEDMVLTEGSLVEVPSKLDGFPGGGTKRSLFMMRERSWSASVEGH